MLPLLVLTLAADLTGEFWGRTVPLKNDQGEMKAVASESHLIVEVKLVAGEGKLQRVSHQSFRLRINGAKLTIPPDAPGMAAAEIHYPDWNGRRGVEAQAGPVIIGRPRPTPRFPGDPNNLPGQDQTSAKTLSDAMTLAALAEGDLVTERKGLLYFPWRGRVAKIKSLDLIWTPAEGPEEIVKLR